MTDGRKDGRTDGRTAPIPISPFHFVAGDNNQAFNDILDAAILSIPVCGEDGEVTERFTYLSSDIPVSATCEPEVNRRQGRAWESWIHWIMGCMVLSVGTCAGG